LGKGDFELIFIPSSTLVAPGLNKSKSPSRAFHASGLRNALDPSNYEVSKACDDDDGQSRTHRQSTLLRSPAVDISNLS
jgi:hypothetical protein